MDWLWSSALKLIGKKTELQFFSTSNIKIEARNFLHKGSGHRLLTSQLKQNQDLENEVGALKGHQTVSGQSFWDQRVPLGRGHDSDSVQSEGRGTCQVDKEG